MNDIKKNFTWTKENYKKIIGYSVQYNNQWKIVRDAGWPLDCTEPVFHFEYDADGFDGRVTRIGYGSQCVPSSSWINLYCPPAKISTEEPEVIAAPYLYAPKDEESKAEMIDIDSKGPWYIEEKDFGDHVTIFYQHPKKPCLNGVTVSRGTKLAEALCFYTVLEAQRVAARIILGHLNLNNP